jgi:hypothetical protein
MIPFLYTAMYYGSLNEIGRERHTYTIIVVGSFLMRNILIRNDWDLFVV